MIATRHATEALRIIEGSARHYVLFVDNFSLNPEVFELFAMLRKRPAVRSRVRSIGTSAVHGRGLEQWLAGGLLDRRAYVYAHLSHAGARSS